MGARRIDPALGPLGCGGTGCGERHRIGAVDLFVPIPRVLLDHDRRHGRIGLDRRRHGQAIGLVVCRAWTAAYLNQRWAPVRWNTEPQGNVPAGSSIVVENRTANTKAALANENVWFPLTNGGRWRGNMGRFTEVRVTLRANPAGESPVLSDLRIQTTQPNRPPDAVDDTLTTDRGHPARSNVLANDTDPDGDEPDSQHRRVDERRARERELRLQRAVHVHAVRRLQRRRRVHVQSPRRPHRLRHRDGDT